MKCTSYAIFNYITQMLDYHWVCIIFEQKVSYLLLHDDIEMVGSW